MKKLLFLVTLLASVSGLACSDFSGEYIAPYDSNVTIEIVQNDCSTLSLVGTDGYEEIIQLNGKETTVDHNPDIDIVSTESCSIDGDTISCSGFQVSDSIRDDVTREYKLLESGDILAKQSVGTLKDKSIFKKL